MKLNDEDKENLKKQLKEHPRFSELLKKIKEQFLSRKFQSSK